ADRVAAAQRIDTDNGAGLRRRWRKAAARRAAAPQPAAAAWAALRFRAPRAGRGQLAQRTPVAAPGPARWQAAARRSHRCAATARRTPAFAGPGANRLEPRLPVLRAMAGPGPGAAPRSRCPAVQARVEGAARRNRAAPLRRMAAPKAG